MTKRIELTEAIIASAPPLEVLWDSVVLGFGLEVKSDGAKRYFCQCQTKLDGARRQHKTRFGQSYIRLPDDTIFWVDPHNRAARDKVWPLDCARQYARQWLSAVKAGREPPATATPLEVALEGKRAGPNAKKKVSTPILPSSIEAVVERFIHEHLQARSPTYAHTSASLLRGEVVERWRGRDVTEITPKDCYSLLLDFKNRLVKNGGTGAQANRLHAIAGRMFRWAMNPGRGLVERNPFAGLERIPEAPRTRELTDAELAAVWHSAELVLRYPWTQFTQMLVLTGQRLREVAGARWADLDLEARKWTQWKNKSKRPHVVRLSPQVVRVLLECKKRQQLFAPHGNYVFMSGIGIGRIAPIRGFPKAKERLDARCDVTDWRWHDLRRTCVSGMARLRVLPHIRAAVLNHSLVGVTEKHYNMHDYFDEKKEALDLWARHVMAVAKKHSLPLTEREAEIAAMTQAVRRDLRESRQQART